MGVGGLIIVFGPLLAIFGLIVGGAFVGGQWGHTMLAVGILGGIAWLVFAIWLVNALNTDI